MLTFPDLAQENAVEELIRCHQAAEDFCASHRGATATLNIEAKRDATVVFALKIRLGAVILTQGELAAEKLVAELRQTHDAAIAGDTPAELVEDLLTRQQDGRKGGDSLFGEGLA